MLHARGASARAAPDLLTSVCCSYPMFEYTLQQAWAPVGGAQPSAAEWFERWLGSDWQPGQPLPESAQPAGGQALRLVHLSDEGETKRKIVHEDFGD